MLRPSRSGRATRWLAWRVRFFGVGAILAVFGIGADVELLRWAALAVLVLVAALSVMAARERRDEMDALDEDEYDPRDAHGEHRSE